MQNFKSIEKYVLDNFKEANIEDLMTGSDTYYYHKCLHILNTRATKMSKEDMEMF